MIARKVLYDTISPTFELRRTVTNTQALGLFAASLDIVPAISGYVMFPRLFHVRKATGAYGVAAVTAFQLLIGPLADNIPAFACTVTGFLDQPAAMSSAGIASGNGLAASFGLLNNLDALANKALSICTKGAALTGAGGDLDVTVIYTLLPITFSQISV